MKLGIVGLAGSGKATVFEALTRNVIDSDHKKENHIAAVRVPDERVDVLSEMYKPRKTVYARVEYFLPGRPTHDAMQEKNIWTAARDCDALIHVVRNYGRLDFKEPTPYKDFLEFDQELMLADLVVTEKRLERLELDKKRNRKYDTDELSLLHQCYKSLEAEIPLRKNLEIASAPPLKGFAFLSAKPMLTLFNNEDDNETTPDMGGLISSENCIAIRGKLEQELVQMSDEEAGDFLSEFNITASAMDRVISQSYKILGLVSFFTVGDDEVRAWTVKKKTCAIDAAKVIHSDIQKGFIRAEVISYKDLMDAGTYHEARKKGTVRLEGKVYEVKDGDIIHFRFNV
jgi:GTP-binding protein YchF